VSLIRSSQPNHLAISSHQVLINFCIARPTGIVVGMALTNF